jgi:hypothetical protein
VDECDFFPKFQQDDVRHVSERYIAKSDPFIVMVSTPNAPDGLFDRIEKEPEEQCIYKHLKLDYVYGLNKIYTVEEIQKAKQSPSFEREYNLKYLGLIGNVFSQAAIDRCISRIEVQPEINVHAIKAAGIDPGFGSAKFGVVILQYLDRKIHVIHAEEYERPNYDIMISTIADLKQKWCKDHSTYLENQMMVVPVPFGPEGASMLQHMKFLIEDSDVLLQIHPKFEKLMTSLRTAVAQEYKLDKEQTVHPDIFDAMRLALRFFRIKE